MKKKNTKQIILEKALELFSVKGYESTSVAHIAQEVGIKAAALYKHYKNKQDIFDTILAEMNSRYEEYMGNMQLNGAEPEQDAGFFQKISEEQLVETGIHLFMYFLHDEFASKFRRMLTIEQYHDPRLSVIYRKQYMDDPLLYQGAMFRLFVNGGFLIPEDPQIMAVQFYAPIYMMLHMCDSQPEREPEVIEMIRKHILQFNKLYKKTEESMK